MSELLLLLAHSRWADSNVAQVFVGTGNVGPERDEDCNCVRTDYLGAL